MPSTRRFSSDWPCWPGPLAVARWPGCTSERPGRDGSSTTFTLVPATGSSGSLMPLASARFTTQLHRSSGGQRTVPAKLELLLNGRHFLEDVGIHISPRQRIRLLGSVAETVAFLHAHSMAVGDFSCKNILFSLQPAPSCFFIDCDSMWRDGESALPPGETPEWELPRGEQLGTPAGDVYKFALLALRVHTGAQHHRDPGRLPDSTWGPLRSLIERALAGPQRDRPLITDWIGPLAAAAAAASANPGPGVVARSQIGRAVARGGTRSPPGDESLSGHAATTQRADARSASGPP